MSKVLICEDDRVARELLEEIMRAEGLAVDAVATGDAAIERAIPDEYDLVISKHGPSGSSDISQGGPFEAPENADVTLSASEFGIVRGDRYRARLVLRNQSGEICRDERRS